MHIQDFTQVSRRFHADFTQNVLRNRGRMVPESFWICSGILAESIYALSMLDSMLPKDFTQISPRFYADLTQNGLRNRSDLVPESFRSRSGMLAESRRNLSMTYPCLIPCNLKISRRFYTDFMQISRRMRCGIVAEWFWNRSGILADPSGIYLCLIHA